MTDIRTRVQALAAAVKTQFVERDPVIDGLFAALLSGQHVLLLGVPGTAKSALAVALQQGIDKASMFRWLLTRFTPPEELLGPTSLKGLENDQYRRVTSASCPRPTWPFWTRSSRRTRRS